VAKLTDERCARGDRSHRHRSCRSPVSRKRSSQAPSLPQETSTVTLKHKHNENSTWSMEQRSGTAFSVLVCLHERNTPQQCFFSKLPGQNDIEAAFRPSIYIRGGGPEEATFCRRCRAGGQRRSQGKRKKGGEMGVNQVELASCRLVAMVTCGAG
jgi:hypothetical protein